MSYTHLSRDERYQIQCLLELGQSAAAIARHLQRHPSTIRRELARNASAAAAYRADAAHSQAGARQSARTNAWRFTPDDWALVMAYLQLDLSPQQVAQRLLLEQRLCISHSCIYQRLQRQPSHCPRLRCGQRRRKARAPGVGQLADRLGIEQRPAIAQERSRLGDWEGDTIVSGQGALAGLLTLAERRSRYTLAAPLAQRRAEPTAEAIIELLRPHRQLCHTLTLDNGKEFAQHVCVARRLDMQVYFADPHSSWQRGLNENHNGLLRYYFPKGSDLSHVSEQQVLDAVHRLNHRPRRCLGWLTPHEVFHGFEMTPLTLRAANKSLSSPVARYAFDGAWARTGTKRSARLCSKGLSRCCPQSSLVPKEAGPDSAMKGL
ncbi:IS30 family transposase [Ottowia testudinis]|uniref:IS30 family transposase n=1 Tax=Ottowia testudinis TaxID=2816950 RepID=UPI001FB0A2B9|nr:IS30 family transposase [Ottowia testudinis]